MDGFKFTFDSDSHHLFYFGFLRAYLKTQPKKEYFVDLNFGLSNKLDEYEKLLGDFKVR